MIENLPGRFMGVAPLNGDTASLWPVVFFVLAAAAIAVVLFLTKKKK